MVLGECLGPLDGWKLVTVYEVYEVDLDGGQSKAKTVGYFRSEQIARVIAKSKDYRRFELVYALLLNDGKTIFPIVESVPSATLASDAEAAEMARKVILATLSPDEIELLQINKS